MSIHPDYRQFLASKRIIDPDTGIPGVIDLPDVMMPHQRDITRWALRRGRAAIFAGTGLGKTLMELTWADRVAAHTGIPVLIFAPLAVSQQHIREAGKFGLSARIVRDQSEVGSGVNVTNYQKIDHFDLPAFGGVVLDESSVLKSTDGKYRTRLISECSQVPFRLAATATPAPNDFMELGNHAEFLGVMSYTDMLATFFVHDGGDTQKWRLKGHAENEFWKWMASWAVMLRQPSDLGYPNDGYDLPPLRQQSHTVAVEYEPSLDTGLLFPMEARTMQERLAARRDSVDERCDLAASVVIGSIFSKLATTETDRIDSECRGNQNTQLTDRQKLTLIQNTLKNVVGRQEAGHPKKTANTCGPITEPTRTSSTIVRESNATDITPHDARNTPTIQNLEQSKKPLRVIDAKTPSEREGLKANTASQPNNGTKSYVAKAEGAPSAARAVRASISGENSASITATKPGQCEASSARIATSGLASSETDETSSLVPSNISTNPTLDRWVIWCHLNAEQKALEKALGSLAISIHGGQSDEEKEQLHLAWLDGAAPILIVKPSMFGHGCNWQCCSNTIFVGLNDSFEQVYQAIRRFWRFGQTKPVNVHFIASEMEGAVVANLRRKEADADHMADQMVAHMADLTSELVRGNSRVRTDYNPTVPMNLPAWLIQEDAA